MKFAYIALVCGTQENKAHSLAFAGFAGRLWVSWSHSPFLTPAEEPSLSLSRTGRVWEGACFCVTDSLQRRADGWCCGLVNLAMAIGDISWALREPEDFGGFFFKFSLKETQSKEKQF